MASHSHFVETSVEEIEQIKDSVIRQNTKLATRYGIKLFKDKECFCNYQQFV
jgi:hypothetical protein